MLATEIISYIGSCV